MINNPEYQKILGSLIRYYRITKAIDVTQLCHATQINRLQLHMIEEGKVEAISSILKAIFAYLKVPYQQLFKNLDKQLNLLQKAYENILYMNPDKIEIIMKQLDRYQMEYSLNFPRYLVVKMFYHINVKPDVALVANLIEKSTCFESVYDAHDYFMYQICLSRYYMKTNDMEKALLSIEKARSHPVLERLDVLYQCIGDYYEQQKQVLKAIEFYRMAYMEYEKAWNIHRMLILRYRMSICYDHLHHHELSYERYLGLLEQLQKYSYNLLEAKVYYALMWNRFVTRNWEECIKYGKLVINDIDDQPLPLFYLAYSYYQLGLYGECARMVGRRVEYKKDERIYYLLYYVWQLLNEQDVVETLINIIEKCVDDCFDINEVKKGLIMDLCNQLHLRNRYEEETIYLKQLLKIEIGDSL